jgi:hypothetical protein
VKPVAIVAGYLVGNPLGGHVLSILHYLVGLQRLGYDVVFVEHYEWSNACYNPQTNARSDDPTHGIAALCRDFEKVGLGRWCYVDVNGCYHGLTREEVLQLCRASAFLLSLWTVTWLPEFLECKCRIFIDLDPGFTQFAMLPTPARSTLGYASPLDFHFLFSYGARLGKPDCPIPTHGLTWLPTRPPVVLDLLPPRFTPEARFFTTVMSWSARKPIIYEGVEYGQKDVEFRKVADLPKRLGPIFEIALAGADAPREWMAAHGWRLADPRVITATPWTYRDYVAGSRGEFSVAVNLEVKSRSGWFSDRTAAYLASGKPVIVQETGFSETLPCGEGLFAFHTADDVGLAVEAIAGDYPRHCAAARDVAAAYFDSDRVLGSLLRWAEIEAPDRGPARVPPSPEAEP